MSESGSQVESTNGSISSDSSSKYLLQANATLKEVEFKVNCCEEKISEMQDGKERHENRIRTLGHGLHESQLESKKLSVCIFKKNVLSMVSFFLPSHFFISF
jgi:hypothetical protein